MKIKILNIFFMLFLLFFLILSIYNADAARTKPRMALQSNEYVVPQREIIVSPYVSYIFAKDLYPEFIADQSGFGAGLNIKNQIYGDFGFIIDMMWTKLKLKESYDKLIDLDEESKNKQVLIISGGFYYLILDEWTLDFCYGAITAGNNVMTIFIPSVNYRYPISDRFYIFGKLSYLITNDWFVDMKYSEKYTSFALTGGISIKF